MRQLRALGNQWGPDFQGLDEVWRRGGEAVARIRLAAGLAGRTGAYRFHPALSDACGHVLVSITSLPAVAGQGGAFVGGGVDEVRLHRWPSGNVLWAHARLREPDADDPHVVIGDVEVYDESGELVTETIDARALVPGRASSRRPARRTVGGLFQGATGRGAAWRARAACGGRGSRGSSLPTLAASARNCVIFAGRPDDRACWCVPALSGRSTTTAPSSGLARPADYVALLDVAGPFAAVIDLWSSGDGVEPDGAVRSSERMVRLLQALRTRSKTSAPHGSGSRPQAPSTRRRLDRTPQPFAAALWGLGKAFSVEHAELWGGLVDLQPGASGPSRRPSSWPEKSCSQIGRTSWPGATAVGSRRAWCAVRPFATPDKPFEARADGTYLVTGGLGGIGLVMARWLVERGARHLILLGRTGLPERSSWAALDEAGPERRRAAAVTEMEALGATVEVAALDVAAEGALDALLRRRRAMGAPDVAGVIHAAGVLRIRGPCQPAGRGAARGHGSQGARRLASARSPRRDAARSLRHVLIVVGAPQFAAARRSTPPATRCSTPWRTIAAPGACGAERQLGHLGRGGHGGRGRAQRRAATC